MKKKKVLRIAWFGEKVDQNFFLVAHAKFGNPTTTFSGRTVMAVEEKRKRKREKEEEKNSASADGGPRSRVHTAGHSAQPSIDASGNFSAHVSTE